MELSDVVAEHGVLAGIAAYGSNGFADVADLLTVDSFSLEANQVVFRCFEHIFETRQPTKLDFPSILSAASSIGLESHFEKEQNKKHLRAISNFPIEQGSIRPLAGKIKKLQIAREARERHFKAADELLKITGDESVDAILSMSQSPVIDYAISLSGPSYRGSVRLGEGAYELFEHYMDNPRKLVGYSTGFPRYDRSIGGGLRPGCVDLIVARQKQGKSFCGANIGYFIAKTYGIHVLAVDTELSQQDQQIRLGALIAGIPSRDIESGACGRDPILRNKCLDAATTLKDLPICFESVIGLPASEILSRMRRWILRTVGIGDNGKANPCVVTFDYIKIMSPAEITKNLAEHQALGFLTAGLKDFMGTYGASCVCFAQQNRDGIDQESTATVRGSDRILDTVTSFSIFKKKTTEERAEATGDGKKYTHKLIPVLSRYGEGVEEGDYINMLADFSISKLEEGPLYSELEKGAIAPKQGSKQQQELTEQVKF